MPPRVLEAKPEQLPTPPIAGVDGNPVRESNRVAEAPGTPHPKQQEHSKEDEPAGDLEENLSEIKMIMEKEKVRRYIIKLLSYQDNMKKMYSVIHGQCTHAMIQKLTADATFEGIQEASTDAISILKLIKKICYKFEAQQFPALAAAPALYKTKQGSLTTKIEWFEQFDNLSTVAEACRATAKLPGITEYIMTRDYGGIEVEDLTDMQLTDIGTKTTNMTLATIYIRNLNHGCYSAIKQKLENDFLMGQNNYPATMTEAHYILSSYWHDSRYQKPTTGNGAVAFTQQGSRNRDKSNGHYAWEGRCVKADAQAYCEKQQQREKDQSQQQPAAKETGIAQLNVGNVMDGIDDSPYQRAHTKDEDVNYDIVLSQNGGHIDKKN
eukprot:jgi/Psemu1/11501/gm1.11501_g